MTGEMAKVAAETGLTWINYDVDSLEWQGGLYGYFTGDFGISNANNQDLIARLDRLTADQPRVWRRTGSKFSSELAKSQWLDELAEVQTQLIIRYFTLHNLPDVIADQCTDVDWEDSEINEMIAGLRRHK